MRGRRPGRRGAVRIDALAPTRTLGYDTRFGGGWISGVVAVVLGVLALGAVLCLRFPALLTTPDARALYPMDVVRFLIHLVLVTAFGLGALSIVLSRRLLLGFSAIGLVVAAILMGGSQVEVTGPIESTRYVGLDWFCLNLFVLALLFVPLELAFSRLPEQGVFRRGWLTDLGHFAVSHLAVQLTVLLTLMPAAMFFSFHAIFVHANVRFTFGPLAWIVGTPRFHHWHHAAQPEAVDKNFAIHLPVIDRLFGTLYLPARGWPAAYGIEDGVVPESYPAQLVFPFSGRPVTRLR